MKGCRRRTECARSARSVYDICAMLFKGSEENNVELNDCISVIPQFFFSLGHYVAIVIIQFFFFSEVMAIGYFFFSSVYKSAVDISSKKCPNSTPASFITFLQLDENGHLQRNYVSEKYN